MDLGDIRILLYGLFFGGGITAYVYGRQADASRDRIESKLDSQKEQLDLLISMQGWDEVTDEAEREDGEI